jgi:mannan endo-1,4-beta-mannosidase
MRDAGIRTTLVIDPSQWGQNINQLQAEGPGLIQHDPLRNLLFSVHMWWIDGSATHIKNELEQSVKQELPLIVGEFAQHAVYECSAHPFDYPALLQESARLEVGWLAWSWGGAKNNDCKDDQPFDMTTDGTFATLQGWGKEVALEHPKSIKNTSVRPRSILGSCD